MKKLYNSKIIQYSLNGEKINEFNNVNGATHIVNYDSIINCCLNKYKTAGGFIWRFENDPFSFNSILDKNHNILCKICNSNESPRSMAMHLKWAHNIKTEEYVLKYGEFRPKKIINHKKSETSGFDCKICNKKLNSNQHLMYHITKFHKDITKHDYIIKYLLNDKVPLCKCGCGNPVTILENGKNNDLDKDLYFRDYIKGHWDWEVFSTIGRQSKEEIELLEFLKTIYHKPIETSVRGLIKNREIDIYLPQDGIGIEYNGLYWHSEKGGKSKFYHLDKLNQAQEKNIRLIQIFSDEWINKKEIVKEKLKSILNLSSNTKIYARKCQIQEIPAKEKNIFLNKNHIQGEDRSQVKLGLFNNEELIAVMTFSKPRISLGAKSSINNIYELSRYASSLNVIGGASKLIKYFQTHFSPTQIYSYSDNRWSDPDNNMYLKIGFIKEKTSSPSYFYTKNYTERIHRFNFNKGKLKKMGADIINKTEHKIMEDLGYTKIWDCGSTKFLLNL